MEKLIALIRAPTLTPISGAGGFQTATPGESLAMGVKARRSFRYTLDHLLSVTFRDNP
jgi:hypothetical protein